MFPLEFFAISLAILAWDPIRTNRRKRSTRKEIHRVWAHQAATQAAPSAWKECSVSLLERGLQTAAFSPSGKGTSEANGLVA